jgi:hypothetical protein
MAWKAMPAAERKVLKSMGAYDPALDATPPPDGLILHVFARALTRSEGKLAPYKTDVARSWEPGRDFAWLTKSEWQSLVPAPLESGARHAVAAPIQDRLIRRYLIDLVRVGGNGGPRRPDQVLARDLTVIVHDAKRDVIHLRIEGSARLSSDEGPVGGKPKVDDFHLTGRMEYDVTRKTINRFELLAFSETGHFDEIHNEVRPMGIFFERIEGKTPAERASPSSWGKDYLKF